MQQTINQLSNQVDKLNDKLTQMQQNDRTLIDMERLTRAEQRAENLRTQQVDVESKLADLQSKAGADRIPVATGEHRTSCGIWHGTSGGSPRGASPPTGE